MNRSQAEELFTLITTVRHVDKMHTHYGAAYSERPVPACLLCEGVRHGLYTKEQGLELDTTSASSRNVIGFDVHFGCTESEACGVLFHNQITLSDHTNGENYYQSGKELIEKYHPDLFETTLSFSALMDELKQPVSMV